MGRVINWGLTFFELGGIISGVEKNCFRMIMRLDVSDKWIKKTLQNAVAEVLCLFLKDRILIREARKAPEGTWVIGGGIELICVYYIYGSKKHKVQVRKGIWKALSSLKGGYKKSVCMETSCLLCYYTPNHCFRRVVLWMSCVTKPIALSYVYDDIFLSLVSL